MTLGPGQMQASHCQARMRDCVRMELTSIPQVTVLLAVDTEKGLHVPVRPKLMAPALLEHELSEKNCSVLPSAPGVMALLLLLDPVLLEGVVCGHVKMSHPLLVPVLTLHGTHAPLLPLTVTGPSPLLPHPESGHTSTENVLEL